MSTQILRLHSTIELPLDDLQDAIDALSLPEGLDGVDVTRRDRKLEIEAVPSTELPKYTPAATLVGTVTNRRIPDPDAPEPSGGPQWGDQEETPTVEIEVVAFKGRLGEVLRSSACRSEMFAVLVEIARAGEGDLTAVLLDDEELAAVRVVDGEDRDAHVEVVEEDTESTGVDWRSNDLIQ